MLLVALAGVAAPALCPRESTLNFLRGASCAYVLITMIGYWVLIGGDYSTPSSLLEHLVVPLMIRVDWLFVCQGQSLVGWWWPLLWFVGPLGYLALYLQGARQYGVSPYPVCTVGSGVFWPDILAPVRVVRPAALHGMGGPRAIRLARQQEPGKSQPQPQRV